MYKICTFLICFVGFVGTEASQPPPPLGGYLGGKLRGVYQKYVDMFL
jgi:hypothetical protein